MANNDINATDNTGGGGTFTTQPIAVIDGLCAVAGFAADPTTVANELCHYNNVSIGSVDRYMRGVKTHTVGTPATGSLKSPLWYAAKWGGYHDLNEDGAPQPAEWDADNDGDPDTYFPVTDAGTLGPQLSKALNEKLFGGADSTGRTVRLDQADFRVVGVADDWRPTPRFYDLNGSRYGEAEQAFLPFSTSRDLRMSRNGSMNCWGNGNQSDDPEGETGLNAPCVWIQYWAELATPAKVEAYRQYLTNYSDQQRASGRFERPTNVRLRSLMEWLDFREVVPGDVRLQVWLAFGFLAVCLLNTVGLLLAKFLRRSSEIEIGRAHV